MKRILIGLCIGSMAMFGASTSPADGGRLLREIKGDAVRVRSAAAQLDQLAEGSNAKWIDYDRQWNEIKPPVEDIQMKVARLAAMQASLTPAQRAELNQIKPLIGELQSRTEQFLKVLDTRGVPTSDARFKSYARSLRNDADKIEKIAPAS
jgi:hypothetical protein